MLGVQLRQLEATSDWRLSRLRRAEVLVVLAQEYRLRQLRPA
jgi:hypothetical protein